MALHDQWAIAADDSFNHRVDVSVLSGGIAISPNRSSEESAHLVGFAVIESGFLGSSE